MENKHVIKVLIRALGVICVIFIIGVISGVVLEYLMPSEFNFNYLSRQEIYNNNIESLFKAIIFGLMSLGVYACFFIFTFGNVIGQAMAVIYSNYGMDGVIFGFFPHAGVELLSCILSATVSIYFWLLIFNTFIKKVELSKKRVVLKSVTAVVVCIIAMWCFCYVAAYIECNITEGYWLERL